MPKFIKIAPQDVALAPGTRVVRREEYSHWLDAQALLKQAQQRAEAIIASACDAKQQACEAGYAQGYRDGQQAQSEALLNTLQQCQAFMAARQGDVLQLALQVCEKLFAELDCQARLTALIQQALQTYSHLPQVVLHLAPEELDALKSQLLSSAAPANLALQQLQFKAAGDVAPGSCRLDTPAGSLTLDVALQFAAIKNALNREVEPSEQQG